MSRWFRHYAGMMRDDKLVRVALKSKQPIERVLWVWGAILESAAEIDDGGRYDVDATEIAYFLRADEVDICAITGGLADAGHVAEGFVVHWGDRQFQSDKSAARVAAHRERKRAENSGSNSGETSRNGVVTLPKRYCIAPETETETYTSVAKATSVARVARKADPFPMPEGVNPQHWADFLENRKRKRLPNTATAHAKLTRDLAKICDDDWPPGRVLEHAAAKGWAGIYDPRNDETQNAIRTGPRRTDHNPSGRTSSAASAVLASLERVAGGSAARTASAIDTSPECLPARVV